MYPAPSFSPYNFLHDYCCAPTFIYLGALMTCSVWNNYVVHVNVDLYKNGVIPDGYTVPCAYSYNYV